MPLAVAMPAALNVSLLLSQNDMGMGIGRINADAMAVEVDLARSPIT